MIDGASAEGPEPTTGHGAPHRADDEGGRPAISSEGGHHHRLRRGVWLFPSAPAPAIVEAIVAADELGLDEVWLADEGVAREPVAVLAAAAQRTRRIRLATGITSPLLRHPGALAASLATLDELSDGRAVLGLGVGGSLSLAPFAIETDRPVGVLREAIETARAVLDRRAGPGYVPPDHAMPARPVEIWVGARGPQLVRTATRLADGVFVSGGSPDDRDRIAAEVSRAERGCGLALYQPVTSTPSTDAGPEWPRSVEQLAADAARLAPTSIGLDLVDSLRGHDPVVLVERAAEALAPLASTPS